MPLPSFFGPAGGIDSKDYILFMADIGKLPIEAAPIKLLNHSFTSPSQNLIDAVTFTQVEEAGGVVRVISKIKRPAQETSRTYTIGLPSAIWTPVVEQALRTQCATTFFLQYLCPPDGIYAHWRIFPDAFLNPPVEAEDVVTTGEETNIITQTTEMNTPKSLIGYALSYDVIYDAGVALNDIVFTVEDCRGCDSGYAQKILAAGGAGGVTVPLLVNTVNRFGSVTTLVSGAAAGAVVTAIYRKNDFIIAGFDASGVGSMRASYDGGTTWEDLGFAEIINDIIDVNGTLVMVGGDGTGGIVAVSSNQGKTITSITSTAIPAAAALNAVAFDSVTQRLYIVGDTGTLLLGRFNGSSLLLTDISANLVGAPGNLNAVCVRGPKVVIVGGAAGYLAQSVDSALTFTEVAIGTAAAITAIAGNFWRMVVAAGTSLFEQTFLTQNEVRQITLANGAVVTGDFTQVRMNLEDDFNRFVACTDDGEVVLAAPFFPGA